MIINLTYGDSYRIVKGIKATSNLVVYAIDHSNVSTPYKASNVPVYFDQAPIALYIPMPTFPFVKDSLIMSEGFSSLKKITATLADVSEIGTGYSRCYFREDAFLTKSLLKGFSIGVECLGDFYPERNLSLFMVIRTSCHGIDNESIIVKDILSSKIKGNFIVKFFDIPLAFDNADIEIYCHYRNPISISEINLITQRIDRL